MEEKQHGCGEEQNQHDETELFHDVPPEAEGHYASTNAPAAAMTRGLIEDFVSRPVWAVVGFSADPGKFGHRIYFDLKRAGYRVYGVNRRGGTLCGEPVYEGVGALPVPVDVVNFVVPPREGIEVVRQCQQAGLMRIWLQPGAVSREILDFCRDHRMEVVSDACAMVEKKNFVVSRGREAG